MTDLPNLDKQKEFWDGWNSEFRGGDPSTIEFCRRQADLAATVAKTLDRPRILEIGCGTGWLCNYVQAFGSVTGVDLSPASIAAATTNVPAGTFVAGDFLAIDLVSPFDLVVSADVISHVIDQQAFVDRIAALMNCGGKLVLMTQNGFVWRRSSHLAPQAEGQLRNWPSMKRLKAMLAESFTIDQIGSIMPGGDRGVLRPVRWFRGGCRVIGLNRPVVDALERARIGRELTIIATRR